MDKGVVFSRMFSYFRYVTKETIPQKGHGSVKVLHNWLRPPLGVNIRYRNWYFDPQWWP